jgi:DNA polymerase I
MVLTEIANTREPLKLITLEYSIEEHGHFVAEPIIEMFCRDTSGERRLIEVEGFYPYFYVTEREFQRHQMDLLQESMVRTIELDKRLTTKEMRMNGSIRAVNGPPKQTLHDEPLVKIETIKPSQVAKLRDVFDETWEADVFFVNRFLVDTGITWGLTVPLGESRIHIDDIEVLDDDDAPDIAPRIHTVDIEVWSGGAFPDPEEAIKPITAITAHDSYSEQYFCGVLDPNAVSQGEDHSWPQGITWEMLAGVDHVDVTVYDDENTMLAAYIEFMQQTDPDLLTGWNSSSNDIGTGFDYPYIINRAQRINEWSINDLAYDNGGVFVTGRGDAVIAGREMFDMLQAYKKTQVHEKRSYALGYIAQEELGYGKEDIEGLDEGWLHHPVEFMRYNIRDVQAVVEIEREKAVIEMYDHIRSIAGATYSEIADSNIGIIDVLFLREARRRGIALPTSVRPDVQHYWGAYVFPPVAGKHEHVVYPDLSSLYPNLFIDMNISPETIIGFEDDLDASPYTEDDCHVVYVDTRDESVKKSVDEPERTPLYVLTPDIKESFVRETIGKLIDMKYVYKSEEYPREAYEAVKRITNSIYGVMGDSVSYGRGFRMFDWRIAEAITLAGRDVIKHTAEEFEQRVQDAGYEDAAIIAGDTDSCVCEIPSAASMDDAIEVSLRAAEGVDGTYDAFMRERYNMGENNMAVEVESYAASAFFMDAKKRYAQWVRWEEGEEVDEIEVKGFELVRSDSSELTGVVQEEVLRRLLKEEDAGDSVSQYIYDRWHEVMKRKVDLEMIGVPSAINNRLMDYGFSVDGDEVRYYTPQPHIRGARYANCYIEGEDLGQGSKPLMFYVKQVSPIAGIPEVYDYDDQLSLNVPPGKRPVNREGMHEIDRRVDAIAVEDVRNIPTPVLIDYEKMAEKTIKNTVEPIADVMNWKFHDMVNEGRQIMLVDFM